MKEGGLVGYVATVVDGQYQVAMLEHGVGHDGLAGFAFAIKVGQPQRWHGEHKGQYGHYP